MADNKSKSKNPEVVTIEEIPVGNGIGGKLEMSEDVVATIAGLAAREIAGIHSLGRSRFISFGDSPTRGVDAEVGSLEAALDLDVVIEYGCNIHEVAGTLRKRIADEVYKMAGRKVVEVNIRVVGIHMEEDKPIPKEPERRVK